MNFANKSSDTIYSFKFNLGLNRLLKPRVFKSIHLLRSLSTSGWDLKIIARLLKKIKPVKKIA